MHEINYIKNNTRFIKTDRLLGKLFIENIVFIQSKYLKENIDTLLVEDNINTIRLTDDYNLDNLNFLNDYDLSFIKSIELNSNSIKNIEGLYNLKNLESIHSVNQKINYSKFPKLRAVFGELSNYSYESFHKLTGLEKIRLFKYKYDDIQFLSENKNLKNLMLTKSKILSLKGLESISGIEILELNHNRRLHTLEGLSESHKNLVKFKNTSLPKLHEVNEHLVKASNLKFIELSAKKIDSFKFLDSLVNLELVNIHNKLTIPDDGDMSPLFNALRRTGGKIW